MRTPALILLAATALAVVDLAGIVELWMVYGLAFVFGVATAVDTPARLSFVIEMVGRPDLPHALALNSAVVQDGRVGGPDIAGGAHAGGGPSVCLLTLRGRRRGARESSGGASAPNFASSAPVRTSAGVERWAGEADKGGMWPSESGPRPTATVAASSGVPPRGPPERPRLTGGVAVMLRSQRLALRLDSLEKALDRHEAAKN